MAACCLIMVQHPVRLHYWLLLRRGYASRRLRRFVRCCARQPPARLRRFHKLPAPRLYALSARFAAPRSAVIPHSFRFYNTSPRFDNTTPRFRHTTPRFDDTTPRFPDTTPRFGTQPRISDTQPPASDTQLPALEFRTFITGSGLSVLRVQARALAGSLPVLAGRISVTLGRISTTGIRVSKAGRRVSNSL
jgi:hypothetical protein